MTAIAFMTANFVAREAGWTMDDWGHGDRLTNERFAPLETYAERLDALLQSIAALGFEAVDLWGAHLNPEWATDDHVQIACDALERQRLEVTTYACLVGPGNVDRACEIAQALGTATIGGLMHGDSDAIVPALRRHGVTLAIENHQERSPGEVLARIDRGEGALAATVDTGWWATQGYEPAQAIEELGASVQHVHLKDVRAVGEPQETCPWGEGLVDPRACLRALEQIGYAGAISVEHEPDDHDPSEECRAMLAQLRGWRS